MSDAAELEREIDFVAVLQEGHEIHVLEPAIEIGDDPQPRSVPVETHAGCPSENPDHFGLYARADRWPQGFDGHEVDAGMQGVRELALDARLIKEAEPCIRRYVEGEIDVGGRRRLVPGHRSEQVQRRQPLPAQVLFHVPEAVQGGFASHGLSPSRNFRLDKPAGSHPLPCGVAGDGVTAASEGRQSTLAFSTTLTDVTFLAIKRRLDRGRGPADACVIGLHEAGTFDFGHLVAWLRNSVSAG